MTRKRQADEEAKSEKPKLRPRRHVGGYRQRDPVAEAELLVEQESLANSGQIQNIRDQEWLFLTLDGPNFKEPTQVQLHLTAGYIMYYPMEDTDVEFTARCRSQR